MKKSEKSTLNPYYVKIGERLNEWRFPKKKENDITPKIPNITQAELADKLHYSRNSYGRLERGERPINADEIRDITEFYRKSSDELLFGVEPKMLKIHRTTGLNKAAIAWLKNENKKSTEDNPSSSIEILNYIFSNSTLAYQLLDCFYVYAMTTLPDFIRPKDKDWIEFIGVDYFDSEKIFADTISDKILNILKVIRNDYSEKRENMLDAKLTEALQKINWVDKNIQKDLEEFEQNVLEEKLRDYELSMEEYPGGIGYVTTD